MKIISWNVNGVRACMKNGLLDYLKTTGADVIALQETKINEPVSGLSLPGYEIEWCFSELGGYSENGERKQGGYSGTACLFKNRPLSIMRGLTIKTWDGDEYQDKEGRIMTLEYPQYYFVNVYTPNSQGRLKRKYYRSDWDRSFLDYVEGLNFEKPVIIGGDFNVAREYIDVYPENTRNVKEPAGFLPEEKGSFDNLLKIGMIDAFRELYPTETGAYTWWPNGFGKREKQQGRRLDYFIISASIRKKIKSCKIHSNIYGSDHAPLELKVKI